jgi:uncharacterized protein involved in type VI secretion and phage assembly
LPGVYAGTVVRNLRQQNSGEPENLGRILVSVESVFDDAAPEHHVWARPCFPFGHVYVPEEGDKIWVAFENGDPQSPVWLGIWYAEGSMPEEADQSPPAQRVIRSAAGHTITLDDAENNEKVIIKDKAGNCIELRGDGVLFKCEQDLTIDASGKNIVIKAQSVDVQEA